jgi:NADH-ubiquinone oxidoreductase chain 2
MIRPFFRPDYTITNAFIILISIGYSLCYYINKSKEYKELQDKTTSPTQSISQLKGYFYINPFLALSLTVQIINLKKEQSFYNFFFRFFYIIL